MYKYLQPYQLSIQNLVLSFRIIDMKSWPSLDIFVLQCDLNGGGGKKRIIGSQSRHWYRDYLKPKSSLENWTRTHHIRSQYITIIHSMISQLPQAKYLWKLSRNRFQGFNTGVVLYNLAAMRESSVYNRSRSWILSFQKNGSLLFPTEQNHFILNIWFLYVLPNTVIWTLGQ